jgi:hypothetical protein
MLAPDKPLVWGDTDLGPSQQDDSPKGASFIYLWPNKDGVELINQDVRSYCQHLRGMHGPAKDPLNVNGLRRSPPSTTDTSGPAATCQLQ